MHDDSAARFATKTSGSGDQLVLEYVHDPVASAKDRKSFENRTDIYSTKILKQLLSHLNNILTL